MPRFNKSITGNIKIMVRASETTYEGIVKYTNNIKADLIAAGVKRRKGLSLSLTDRNTERVISTSKIPVPAIDNSK